MNQVHLQHTVFQIEKLMNVVGIGRTSAYQVITTPGRIIGVIGPVANPASIHAINEASISATARSRLMGRLRGWLRS